MGAQGCTGGEEGVTHPQPEERHTEDHQCLAMVSADEDLTPSAQSKSVMSWGDVCQQQQLPPAPELLHPLGLGVQLHRMDAPSAFLHGQSLLSGCKAAPRGALSTLCRAQPSFCYAGSLSRQGSPPRHRVSAELPGQDAHMVTP